MSEERRQNLAETDRGSYYNPEEWFEEFLDGKAAFYNDGESDDSDIEDQNYNENNEQQQLSEDFGNNYCKIVSSVMNNFAVCKHCSGTRLLVDDVASSHGYGSIWNFTCEKEIARPIV